MVPKILLKSASAHCVSLACPLLALKDGLFEIGSRREIKDFLTFVTTSGFSEIRAW